MNPEDFTDLDPVLETLLRTLDDERVGGRSMLNTADLAEAIDESAAGAATYLAQLQVQGLVCQMYVGDTTETHLWGITGDGVVWLNYKKALEAGA